MKPLPLLESLNAAQASMQRLFGGDHSLRSIRKSQDFLSRVNFLETCVADALHGDRKARFVLQEAIGASDFPLLMADILDRQLLGFYAETPQTYRNYVKIRTVADFRDIKIFDVTGSESVLDKVPAQSEYPESSLAEAKYTYHVDKYGRRIPLSWELLVNDDLSVFTSIPRRFGRAARRSEEKFATQLFVDANGPHASLYTSGNKNIVNTTNGASATNPALSISGLQDAMLVMSKLVDADGEPIVIETVELVVPPALEITAQNILNATELWLTGAGGTSTQQVHTRNWMRNRLRLSVNAYIPVVASSANGNTSWFLFASASSSERTALEMAFLRGHESPEIAVRTPNSTVLSGAGSTPAANFDTDTIDYRIRHVFGGARIDAKCTVASNGSGS